MINAQSVKYIEKPQNHFRNVLHLIDHATRSSVSSFVKSKQPEVIFKAIFKSWIQIYGAPEKLLTDNGQEFANSKFIYMAESMNIKVKVKAAESPFTNGLAKRHNFIIADMMEKVLEESQHIDMDLTLAWCLNAKNSLANMMVFYHFNLYLDKTPNRISTFTNKPPVLIQHNTSTILTDNLTVLHKARQALILVKYGSKYVRVHPCQLPLARNAYNNLNPNAIQKSTKPSQIRDKHNSHIILESESKDEIIEENNNSYNDLNIGN